MSGMQKRTSTPQPGCIGRTVNLFDTDGSTAAKKLVMDKPYNRGSSLPICQVHLAMPSEENDLMSSQFRKNSCGTPMKMLLDHELSKEVESKYTPPNLVARLMGLDTLPKRQINTFCRRKEDCGSTMTSLEEALPSWRLEPELLGKDMIGGVEQYTEEFVGDTYHGHGINEDDKDKQDVARHLSTNENLDSSEESSEGIAEILKSNKDLFLELLQQPSSLFIQHLHEMSIRSPGGGVKRITVLKPSKADNNSFPSKKTEKWVTKPAQISQANMWSKINIGGFPVSSNWKADDDLQPTRIVVLKPSLLKDNHTRDEYASPSFSPRTLHDQNCFVDKVQHNAQQSRDMAKEITNIIRERLGRPHMDESFLSSVLSSGYNGDESSPDKSENEDAAGSDCEAMSPTSWYSWGYINQSATSAISRVPRARESKVCREAKKRLSRRWNAMGLNGNSQEQRHAHSHISNTLGEMLAFSEINKSIKSPDNNEEEPVGSTKCFSQNLKENETAECSPRNFNRSNYVPLSAVGNYDWVDVGISHSEVAKSSAEKELQKSNSLKQLVASLFFTRNKKSDRENPIGGTVAEGTATREVGLSVMKPGTTVNLMESQDQPSPISVLEPLFADDDSRSADSSGILISEHPVLKTSVSNANSPMIGKSPPIESIARTLCWNSSYADTASACPLNLFSVCSGSDEEQDWCILVPALLSTLGLINDIPSDAYMDWWDAPQLPLDPLLRDKYADAATHIMHGAERRRCRSNRKLIFDSVNEALKDICQLDLVANIKSSTGHSETVLPLLVDQVWARMSEWISDEVRCLSSDDGEDINHNLAVEKVVRTEVAGKRWLDRGFVKNNAVGIDIEQKLLDELLEEAVLQLTAR